MERVDQIQLWKDRRLRLTAPARDRGYRCARRKELGLDTTQAYRFISKWGPCTRTIIHLLSQYPEGHAQAEEEYAMAAHAAAANICANPIAFKYPVIQRAPHGVGSTVLFMLPCRPRDPRTSLIVGSGGSIPHIPTPYLTEIFNRHRRSCANEKAFELFQALSSHALTRPASAWHLEKRMHAYLCRDSQPLIILHGRDSSAMQPSQLLLVGTAGALARCRAYTTFYWLPSVADYPGIDGVLADSANVYAVRATTADELEHGSPADGLRKIWANLDRRVRDERTWNIVFVTDSAPLARERVDRYVGELEGFTLGRAKIPVNVWGCVLPSR
ncbi:hypothetical protein C8T65DRAFT_64068 [Cerioporus squamosus]|nr:hypothetical protein C8T65DRAFT_64068 [Cerioporus squamosus]